MIERQGQPSRPDVMLRDRPGHERGLRRPDVAWSAGAVVGRQASQLIAALVIARVLGPETYGVISAATVYVLFMSLLLDQGLAAALVQRTTLEDRTPGAVATLNLAVAAVLMALTWWAAPGVASFFRAPDLEALLRVLGLAVVLKAVGVTPRALHLRALAFRRLALIDIVAGVAGAVTGIVAVMAGAGFWAMAGQVVVTDLCVALPLAAGARWQPNLSLRLLGGVLPFSTRIFFSNMLAFLARNGDNILVGRILGVTALSYYSMGYRMLAVPVQMVGQTVNRVAFPTMARQAGSRDALRRTTVQVSELLSLVAVPPMLFVAAAAHELVPVVLGDSWRAAAPVLALLAIAGARETCLVVTHSLMRAVGAGRLILRYEIGATFTQLVCIIAGLRFGVVGVAAGVVAAGFLLTPVLVWIQGRLCGQSVRSWVASVLPGIHCGCWGVAAYLIVRSMGLADAPTLVVGGAAYCAVALAALGAFHRGPAARLVGHAQAFSVASGPQGADSSSSLGDTGLAVFRVPRTGLRRLRRLGRHGFARVRAAHLTLVNRWTTRAVVGSAPVVVSMTTHGRRVDKAWLAVESIAAGRLRPRRLVLWLDDPALLTSLPPTLRRLRRRGLEVRLTKNYGPHTKYYPYASEVVRHELPLATADDDILYPRQWLQVLLRAHLREPALVHCYRAAIVGTDSAGVAPYNSWQRCTDRIAGLDRFATGVSGVIYPTAMLDALRRRGDAFLGSAPRADDVWLHWVALREGFAVRQVSSRPRHFPVVPGSQVETLVQQNVGNGGNDQQIAAVYTCADVALLNDARPRVARKGGDHQPRTF